MKLISVAPQSVIANLGEPGYGFANLLRIPNCVRMIEPPVQCLRSSLLKKICNQCLKINGKINSTSCLISCNLRRNLVPVFRCDALNVGVQLELNEARKTTRI